MRGRRLLEHMLWLGNSFHAFLCFFEKLRVIGVRRKECDILKSVVLYAVHFKDEHKHDWCVSAQILLKLKRMLNLDAVPLTFSHSQHNSGKPRSKFGEGPATTFICIRQLSYSVKFLC